MLDSLFVKAQNRVHNFWNFPPTIEFNGGAIT